jgi:hypothetical protein
LDEGIDQYQRLDLRQESPACSLLACGAYQEADLQSSSVRASDFVLTAISEI